MCSLQIRNFAIIAHIDHGKTTLADRLIEFSEWKKNNKKLIRHLDSLNVEKTRGITIKSSILTLDYILQLKKNSEIKLQINLIDTPGHVDFSYEVERALAAADGALLLVDATQGVQAQTLANLNMALSQKLCILPVINKIDLPNSRLDSVVKQLHEKFNFLEKDVVKISAKTGLGVENLLNKILNFLPEPRVEKSSKLKMLIIDAHYDDYMGVVFLIKVVSGILESGMNLNLLNSNLLIKSTKIGQIKPEGYVEKTVLKAGDLGFICCNLKKITPGLIGDTIVLQNDSKCVTPLSGFKRKEPIVFSSIYPMSVDDYDVLKMSIEKLTLNDCSVSVEPENSTALGFGFRCGFFGTLHLEVFLQRLESEFQIEALTTLPNIVYQVVLKTGKTLKVNSPTMMPASELIESVLEPFVKSTIITPSEFVGGIMKLASSKRAVFENMSYLDETLVELTYQFPMAEIVFTFIDELKACSKGYATFDYVFSNNRPTKVEKLDILLSGERVDALSMLVYGEDVVKRGKQIVEKLQQSIPRQLFDVAIQAAVGSKIVARETVKALRKDVLAKCYGGDITRKKKLLEKQKRGKKKMKQIGSVDVPKDAFLAVLKMK